MSSQTYKKGKAIILFDACLDDAPGFCAVAYINDFCNGWDDYPLDPEDYRGILTYEPKEAALEFVKMFVDQTHGGQLVIADLDEKFQTGPQEERGMHHWITPHLPKVFKHNGNTCTVTKRKPFTNWNTGNRVKEVVITITRD